MSGPYDALPGNARNGQLNAYPTCWSTELYDYALVTRVDWHPVIWRRPAGYSEWEDSFDLSSTAMGLVNVADSHYAVSLCVDHLERVWVAGNAHASESPVVVSSPGEIDDFEEWAAPSWLSHSQYTTYHTFNCWSDGQVFWSFDGLNLPNEGLNRDWVFLKMDKTTDEWAPVIWDGRIMRIDNHGLPNTDDLPDRSYILGHHIDGFDRLHVLGVWRMQTSVGASMTRSFYIRSDDRGLTWQNVEGDNVTTPLYYETTVLEDEATIYVDGNPVGCVVGAPMCTDSSGYPVFIGTDPITYGKYLCRWDGSEWVLDDLAGWPSVDLYDALPGIGLRSDGSLIITIRDSNTKKVTAYNYDEGPSTVDKVLLGFANIGTPDGTYLFESGATYRPMPLHASRFGYRSALQYMVPEVDTPRIRRIGSNPSKKFYVP